MKPNSGTITVLTVLVGLAVFALAAFFEVPDLVPNRLVSADTATTTVTVLNTPPEWQVDAQEYFESSTSTPTHVDEYVTWVGTASDSNSEPYYLLLCKTSSTPTANSGSAPTCAGGAGNLWGVSASTGASVQATTTYLASSTTPEENPWFAWVCDQNASNPRCNTEYKQGTGNTASPFYVNHRPILTTASDDTPVNPGTVVTWVTNASDTDVVTVPDTVRLFVCRANDFNFSTTTPACGGGGTYCTSTAAAASPTCSSTLASVLQDRDYTAYPYVVDVHNLYATGGASGVDTVVSVNNVAPTISSSTLYLKDTDGAGDLTLGVPGGQTSNFRVELTVTDLNSCSSTLNIPEISISSTLLNVYRGSSTCSTVGNYNPNNCYPSVIGTSSWNYSCSQDAGSCSGSSDPDATFTCLFPLWFLSDPTDGTSTTEAPHFDKVWWANAQATDDDSATSSLVETAVGTDLLSYLAYALNSTTIAFGGLQPGSSTDPLFPSTTVRATGNVGLDHTLYGDHMCTTYPTCAAGSPTSTIQIYYQRYATSSVAYSSTNAFTATSSPGAELEINILKSTQTSSPAQGSTYWGIHVPVSLQLAGDYTGMNTIIGVKGEGQFW